MDTNKRPLLICLTPVKNEAWCLNAFLSATSVWADKIILANQHSSDDTILIAGNFPKVVVISNDSNDFNEPQRQKLLIEAARKIEGDKILFALDADEIFTGGFEATKDWQEIINSKPGDVFGFQWANILPDRKHYYSSSFYYPWVFHDDGVTPHELYAKDIHSMRIPYPQKADFGWYQVKDFKVLHLAHIYPDRVKSKWRYYQCVEVIKAVDSHPIASFRSYNYRKEIIEVIPPDWFIGWNDKGVDILCNIDIRESIFWFDEEVVHMLKTYGLSKFKNIHIWDKYWLLLISSKHPWVYDPRNYLVKIIHKYLSVSQHLYPAKPIKAIDKVLKLLS